MRRPFAAVLTTRPGSPCGCSRRQRSAVSTMPVEAGVSRPEPQLAADLRGRGHEPRGIARPARADLARAPWLPVTFSTRGDDLPHRVARLRAQVVGPARLSALEGVEGQHVGEGQVLHVDVVADAGAVGRVVVVAEDGEGRAAGPSAASMARGIRWISGSWSSPSEPSGWQPDGVEVAQAIPHAARPPRRGHEARARRPACSRRRG